MPRNVLVPLIVACALFMENMDSTVLATSLPVIARDLAVDPIALKLALTSYLVSLAVFIPVSGWMADRFGARTIFRAAILVFMAGSLLCAVADSLGWFVFARFVQGMGGAMMVPVGRLVILRTVPKAEMVQALAYLTVPAMLGPVIGPPLGGFISTFFDWRWIFFINIPIGLVGMVLASVFIENVRERDVPPLDLAGFALTAIGLSALMMGFSTGGRHLVSQEVSALLIIVGAVTLFLYWLHTRRAEHPVIDLSLLRIPTFRAGVIGGSLFRIGIGAVPFLLPLMLQLGFGLNALQSGLLTFAAAAGAMFMKTLAARILRMFGFRRTLALNCVIACAFLAATGLFTPHTPHVVIIAVLLAGGFFRSLQFTSINAVGYADVTSRDMSLATSFSSAAQQISLSMGVAVGALALETTGHFRGTDGLQAGDFAPAFLVVSLFSLTSLAFWLRLAPDAGAEVSGHARTARQITAEAVQENMPGR